MMLNRRSYDGDQNPNFKNAGLHNCLYCKKQFHSYVKTRKYCSHTCYTSDQKTRISQQAIEIAKLPRKAKKNLGRNLVCIVCNTNFRSFSKSKYCENHKNEAAANKVAQIKLGQPSNPDKKTEQICLHCKTLFQHYKTKTQLYCSYKCHLDSGGAWRAGMAASEATMKYGAKKDANHNSIVDALQAAGAYVLDMSHVGRGFPDLIIGFQSQTILMEIKNSKTSYGKKGLNKNQQKWKDQWIGGAYCVVDSPDAALRMIGVIK